LNLATEIKDKKGMAASYNNLGIAYKNVSGHKSPVAGWNLPVSD